MKIKNNKQIIIRIFGYFFVTYFLLTGILVSRTDVFAYGLGTGESCAKDEECDGANNLACIIPPGVCAPPGSGTLCNSNSYCENQIEPKGTMSCQKVWGQGYCLPKTKIPTNLDLNAIEENYKPKTATKPVESLKFTPQVSIPNSYIQGTVKVGYSTGTKMASDLLPQYVGSFYRYGLMIVGLIATVTLMGGGILWLTSMGNDSKITKAKEMIFGSLTGVALLYGSYLILNTINPELIQLKTIESQSISKVELDNVCCLTASKSFMTNSTQCLKENGKRFSGAYAKNGRCEQGGCCVRSVHFKNNTKDPQVLKCTKKTDKKNGCEPDVLSSNGNNLVSEYKDFSCESLVECKGTNFDVCEGVENGKGVFGGYCFDGFLLDDEGKVGEKCGRNGGICTKLKASESCDDWDANGRSCAENGVWCCVGGRY